MNPMMCKFVWFADYSCEKSFFAQPARIESMSLIIIAINNTKISAKFSNSLQGRAGFSQS